MNIAGISMSLLYLAGGVLPLYAILHALRRVYPPGHRYKVRQDYIAALRGVCEDLFVASDDYPEAESDGTAWITQELHESDPWGVPYNQSDFYFGTSSHGQDSYQSSRKLLTELLFVGGGLICGTAASIWSVLASIPET
ncbi:hypothetical protein [Crystallibacter degradans]|uniref:hypothetical protein n=1 Tax=Crystallibacter degradans TaxID=2726743 RepID=UPI001472DCCC|nr:hypothetical protein [Arthrobacter sp. SF27]NMR28639.1 hypothetical protein [Arthrobacter sp. SF27]